MRDVNSKNLVRLKSKELNNKSALMKHVHSQDHHVDCNNSKSKETDYSNRSSKSFFIHSNNYAFNDKINCFYTTVYKNLNSSSSSFEGYPLQVRHKQDWGRGFILLLPQTAALPGSDAGSDVIKPASSFVIQNRQTLCSMWCPMYRARC